MDWRSIPLSEHVTEAARIVGEAEIVIDFGPEARGWFRVAVFEDLKATPDTAYFARAVDDWGPRVESFLKRVAPRMP